MTRVKGIPHCVTCDVRLYPNFPGRRKYCSDKCAQVDALAAQTKRRRMRKTAAEGHNRRQALHRKRVKVIRAKLLDDPFISVRELENEINLKRNQIDNAVLAIAGKKLIDYRRDLHSECFVQKRFA